MFTASFPELLRVMIQDAEQNVHRLRQQAEMPHLSGRLHHAINDVLHAESLRIEMLKMVVAESEEA